MADQKEEEEKLRKIKSFSSGNNRLFFGPRLFFDKSEFREVEMVGKKLCSFIEAKILSTKSQALLNLGFDIVYLNNMQPNVRYMYISKTIKNYINMLKENENMVNVNLCFISLHSIMTNYFIHFIDNGFMPITDVSTIKKMKLPIDGIHISLMYKLK